MIDLYLQIQFANRVGVHLENFTQKKPHLWAFSHSCEKAVGRKRKQVRGFIYQHISGELNVKCHKCGYSSTLTSFIKDVSPVLYNEIRLARFKEEPVKLPTIPVPEKKETIVPDLQGLIPVTKLSKSSSVIQFLNKRCIPESKFDLFYVAVNFYSWASRYKPEFADIRDDSPRLVMPYFNNGRVIGFTCRAFDPNAQPRYIHLRIDHSAEFVYGLDRVDLDSTIYVTEGQIDSLFIDNAIAIGGANYSSEFIQSIKSKCVIIPDNDWKRNPHVAKQLKMAIDSGFNICFMPDNLKGKDINDLVKNGVTDIKALIDSHTFQGLAALLEYSLKKKIKG